MFWDDIIETADPRWQETLQRFPRHDFYHLPAYVALEAERRGAKAGAYVLQSDQGAFLVPLVESPVPVTLQPSGPSPADVTAPYGYAGPLFVAEGDEQQRHKFMSLALARLTEYLRCRNVCALMMRFHPLLPVPLQPFQATGHLILHGETVSVNLSQTPEQLWADTRGRYRTYIRGLQRDGYTLELDPAGKEMNAFIELYFATMRRVGASPDYFFSPPYFLELQKLLGPQFLLAHVRSPAGVIVSSGLFTICGGIVQYHLSGNDIGETGANALKLLLHGIRQWAKEQGCGQFHLGGGVGAKNDSLFLFKSGFSSGRAPFHTWRLIVDDAVYQRLCRKWERLNQTLADSPDGFFPAYRKMLPPPLALGERQCA